jgi:hypothetical protein
LILLKNIPGAFGTPFAINLKLDNFGKKIKQ